MFRYELGAKVKDKVTGYTGIIVCQSKWLYGCIRYVVQSQEMKDGKPVDPMGLDEDALDVVAGEALAQPENKVATGGVRPDVTRRADAAR